MFIIRFSEGVSLTFSKTAGVVTTTMEPEADYVFTAAQYAWLKNQPCSKVITRTSRALTRVRNFVAAESNPGESLLFFAGAGGYGDQLLAAPAAALLARRGYAVTVATDPGNVACWSYPWMKGALTFPMKLADFMAFEHHAIFEFVTNCDEHQGQLHPVDSLLFRLGIDHERVAPADKVLAPWLTPEELTLAAQFAGGRRLAFYQLGGSGDKRRLLPEPSRRLFLSLAEHIPELHWIGLGDSHIKQYMDPLPFDAPPNAEIHEFGSLRILFALVSQCCVAVGIDSVLMHAAGAFGRPFVGLWGPLAPDLRMRYYKNQTVIWNKSCPKAPCLHYRGGFDECPPVARSVGMCLCFKDIDSNAVVGAVREAIA